MEEKMKVLGELEKCRLYIESRSKTVDENGNIIKKPERGPCITISRETGTSAKNVSEKVISLLEKYQKENAPPWAVCDRDIIEKVLDDYQLPKALADLAEEDKYSHVNIILSELFVGHAAGWTLYYRISRTILQLAELGNIIIIGRGANVITAKLTNSFHVRLIAPLEERIKRFSEIYNLDKKTAAGIIAEHDNSRKKYLKSIFNKKIDDPFLYHLIVNTSKLSPDDVAYIIGEAVLKKFPKMFTSSDINRQEPPLLKNLN
jgi:cytidylate kinase